MPHNSLSMLEFQKSQCEIFIRTFLVYYKSLSNQIEASVTILFDSVPCQIHNVQKKRFSQHVHLYFGIVFSLGFLTPPTPYLVLRPIRNPWKGYLNVPSWDVWCIIPIATYNTYSRHSSYFWKSYPNVPRWEVQIDKQQFLVGQSSFSRCKVGLASIGASSLSSLS